MWGTRGMDMDKDTTVRTPARTFACVSKCQAHKHKRACAATLVDIHTHAHENPKRTEANLCMRVVRGKASTCATHNQKPTRRAPPHSFHSVGRDRRRRRRRRQRTESPAHATKPVALTKYCPSHARNQTHQQRCACACVTRERDTRFVCCC